MIEAALFYESSLDGLGSDFLDDYHNSRSFKRVDKTEWVAVAHHGRAPGYWRSRIN
jgi:hypothetical protein